MKIIKVFFIIFLSVHAITAQNNSDSLGYRLLEIVNSKENYEQITAMMLLEKEKDYGENSELFREFFQDYFAWDSLKAEIVEIYSREFSQSEIQELISFYETPIGKKLVLKEPLLSAKMLRVIDKRVQDTSPILFQILKENYIDFLRDTSTTFNDYDNNDEKELLEIIDTTIISAPKSSDCQRFYEGKFSVKGDTSGTYILRKDGVQHEILEFLNIDMELKVEWLNDCEYNLIFIKNKNKKFSFYEPGETINIKISEIRGNEYDCFVKNKRGTIKTTLIKIE